MLLIPASWPPYALSLFAGLSASYGGVHLSRRLLQRASGKRKRAKQEEKAEGPQTTTTTNGTTVGKDTNGEKNKGAFAAFQREYLTVYLITMLADWLQGTNMYTLYSGYGMPVSTLFLTGFSSSLAFGTFLGLLVDRYGRKRACVLFCLLEIVINALEHVPNMPILLFGRVLGGISTSLLFSAFESWMVAEHRKRNFDETLLASTFSLAAAGNGGVAVAAGFMAQVASDRHGDIGPFRLAIFLTVVSLGFVARWPENYGVGDRRRDDGSNADVQKKNGTKTSLSVFGAVSASFRDAWQVLRADARCALLACASALFEGATFTFVFMWVPTLLRLTETDLPLGVIFACFMICIAAGGDLFGLVCSDLRSFDNNAQKKIIHVEVFSLIVLVVAASSMLVPALCPTFAPTLTAFLVLETCVGAFGAAAATMRSKYIPDRLQSAVMNLSRVPLNLLVVAGTTAADTLPPKPAFLTVAAAFAVAALTQVMLIRVVSSSSPAEEEKKKKKN